MWYFFAAFAAIVIVLLVLWTRKLDRIFKPIFADTHFLEIARRLPALKGAALARTEDDTGPIDDERHVVTDAWLVIIYTVTRRGGGFDHVLSVNVPQYHTAHAVGDMHIHWLLHLLGVDPQACELSVLPSSAHYATWIFDAARNAEFARRSTVDPSEADLAEFRAHWSGRKPTDRWQYHSRS